MTTGRSLRVGEAVFASAVFCLGLVLAVQTVMLGSGPGYSVIGPQAFPAGVAAALLILGALEFRAALRGHISHEGGLELDWNAFAKVAVALIAFIVLLPWFGWIPAATLLFFVVARALASRRLLLDLLIGVAMALGTFLIFNYLLGLSLPWGSIVEPWASRLGSP